MVDKYQTLNAFSNNTGSVGILQAVSVAVPPFFPIALFLIWLLGTASSYFAILKSTGKKRFWQSLTAMSFAMFIIALLFASMNTASVIILNGYWVGFYILMTLGSWYALSQYK